MVRGGQMQTGHLQDWPHPPPRLGHLPAWEVSTAAPFSAFPHSKSLSLISSTPIWKALTCEGSLPGWSSGH
jgi:hypothetical protein